MTKSKYYVVTQNWRSELDKTTGFFGISGYPNQQSAERQSTIIRCPGCGGPYQIDSEYLDALPADNGKARFPCKYRCEVRADEVRKRVNDQKR